MNEIKWQSTIRGNASSVKKYYDLIIFHFFPRYHLCFWKENKIKKTRKEDENWYLVISFFPSIGLVPPTNRVTNNHPFIYKIIR